MQNEMQLYIYSSIITPHLRQSSGMTALVVLQIKSFNGAQHDIVHMPCSRIKGYEVAFMGALCSVLQQPLVMS